MARTHRAPYGGFAGTGAVAQGGGSLPIYICNTCDHEVVWATAAKTGRKYLVNVSLGQGGQRFYIGSNIHRDPVAVRSAEAVREDLGSLGDQIASVLIGADLINERTLGDLAAAAKRQLADIDPLAHAVWQEYAVEYEGWDGEAHLVLLHLMYWLMKTAGRMVPRVLTVAS